MARSYSYCLESYFVVVFTHVRSSRSRSAVSASSDLNHQGLSIEIVAALDVEVELGVLPGEKVKNTVLVDLQGSLYRPHCSSVRHKLASNLHEVSECPGGGLQALGRCGVGEGLRVVEERGGVGGVGGVLGVPIGRQGVVLGGS